MRNYLFYRFLVFSVLLVSSLAIATPRIIIKHATLVDAANPVRENMTVVLQGDVIQSVAESGSVMILIDSISLANFPYMFFDNEIHL